MLDALLLAAAVTLAPPPPPPPAPEPTPAGLQAPAVPPEPGGHVVDYHFFGDHNEVISRRDAKGRLVVVARDGAGGWVWTGHDRPPQVMTFKDEHGRAVTVYADHAVGRDEVERLLSHAHIEGERAREQGRLAREAGERARVEGEGIHREALESARHAVEAAGLSARDYAALGDVRSLRVLRDGAGVTVDGRTGPGFAEGPQVRALRDEVRALREELKALRAEVDRERVRR